MYLILPDLPWKHWDSLTSYRSPGTWHLEWTKLVGKAWSVFHGAVRTYMPRLDFERDTPTRHPLATVERIIFWEGTDLTGEPAFASFLLDTLRLHAANKRFDWGDLLFISRTPRTP